MRIRRSRVAEGECLQRRELGFEDLECLVVVDDDDADVAAEEEEEDDDAGGMVVLVNTRWRMFETNGTVFFSLFLSFFFYLFIGFFRAFIIIIF